MKLNTIRHYLSVAACFSRLSVQRQLEYPIFLSSWFIYNFIQWFGGLWLIYTITTRFGPLGGWNTEQVVFIFSLALISHGLVVTFCIQTWRIGYSIVFGEFDRILLRPMNSFFLLLTREINFIGFSDMLPGLIIFFYICKQIAFAWTVMNIIQILVILLGAVLIRTALFLFVGSISFWKMNRDVLTYLMVYFQQQVTSYPLSIYPHILQTVFTFIIPVGFVSFYPASQLLNHKTRIMIPGNLTVITLLTGIIFFLLAYRVFKTGLKKYESVGN